MSVVLMPRPLSASIHSTQLSLPAHNLLFLYSKSSGWFSFLSIPYYLTCLSLIIAQVLRLFFPPTKYLRCVLFKKILFLNCFAICNVVPFSVLT